MARTPGPWGDLFAQKLAKRIGQPVASLALLPTDAPVSTVCWVASRGGLWVRTTESGTTAWRRTRVSDPKWAARTTWYIGSTGSDDNDGGQSNTALRTVGELFARLANNPLQAGVTVYILDSTPETDLTYYGHNKPDGVNWLYFEGVPVVEATGTIASVTNWAGETNTDGVITGSSSLVSHVGKLLRITGGAREGARFWLVKNTTGATVRITPVLDGSYSSSTVSLQVGDPYEVLRLPHLADTLTVVHGTDVQFALVSLGTSDNAHSIIVNGAATFDGCQLYGVDVYGGGTSTLYGCRIGQNIRAQGEGTISASGCVAYGTTVRTGGTATLTDHIVHEGRMNIEPGGLVKVTDDSILGIYDYAGGAVALEGLGRLHVDGYLIGKSITGDPAMIDVGSGAVVVYTNVPTITGSGVESLVGGYERDFSEWPYVHPDNGAAAVDDADDTSPTASGGGSATTEPVLDDFGAIDAPDDDGIVTTFATSTSLVTKSGAGLNGVVGATVMDPPRNIVITTAAASAAYNTTDPIVITGTDVFGNVLTESRTPLNANGNEDLVGLKCFRTITSIAFPAQLTTGGSFKVGFGVKIGPRQKVKWTVSQFLFLQAFYIDGSPDTTPSYTTIGLAASPPNGAIDLTSFPPDGGTQFAAAYIKDLT